MATETVVKVSKKAINAETQSEFSEIFKKVFASMKD
jgi:type II restriction/modification system DNA methylase subunit YeeA